MQLFIELEIHQILASINFHIGFILQKRNLKNNLFYIKILSLWKMVNCIKDFISMDTVIKKTKLKLEKEVFQKINLIIMVCHIEYIQPHLVTNIKIEFVLIIIYFH